MADTKITALAPIGAIDPANDVLPIVDVSDHSMAASGTTCRVTTNQLLQANAIASLASATISGDLTVDTSTLYVSSSADKVGIGTTSLSNEKLTVAGNISANAWLGRSNIAAPAGDCSIFRSADNTLGFGIASSTAMTLNSTGLGVGVAPGSGKIAARAGTAATGNSLYADNIDGTYNPWIQIQHSSAGIKIFNSSSFGGSSNNLIFGNGTTSETMRIDSSGNVGIGVTPSAWGSTYRALQIGIGTSLTGVTNDVDVNLVNNARFDGTNWRYMNTSPAERYRTAAGTHFWYNAASGTAAQTTTVTSGNNYTITAAGGTNYTTFGAANNNVGTTFTATSSGTGNGGGVTQNITWTQAMTLDASGRLIINSATFLPPTLNTNGELNFIATSNTNVRFSYRGTDGVTRVANITLA